MLKVDGSNSAFLPLASPSNSTSRDAHGGFGATSPYKLHGYNSPSVPSTRPLRATVVEELELVGCRLPGLVAAW